VDILRVLVNKQFANTIIKRWPRDDIEEDEKEKGVSCSRKRTGKPEKAGPVSSSVGV
jgi:hypothetical protein